jgi:hypothetical protein
MNKINFLRNAVKTVAVLAVSLTLASCGGSGSRLPQSALFGNIPSLVYQHIRQDSIRQAKGLAEIESAKDNRAKAQKILEKYQEQDKEAKAKFKADIKKEIAALNGKGIPFSQDEELYYKVSDVKIDGVSPDGKVQIGFSVKITDASKLRLSFPWGSLTGEFLCPVQLLDKAGEIMENNSFQRVYFFKNEKINGEVRTITNDSEMKNGYEFYQVTSFIINKDNANTYANAAKVHFPQLDSEKPKKATTFTLTDKGVACLKKGVSLDNVPRACDGFYDRYEINLIEDESEGDYNEITFYAGKEKVAEMYAPRFLRDFTVNNATIYSPNVSTPEGVHPGMLLSELANIKGLDTDNNGNLTLNGFGIGFSFDDLTPLGKETHQEAYAKGITWKISAACFKEGAKVQYIHF